MSSPSPTGNPIFTFFGRGVKFPWLGAGPRGSVLAIPGPSVASLEPNSQECLQHSVYLWHSLLARAGHTQDVFSKGFLSLDGVFLEWVATVLLHHQNGYGAGGIHPRPPSWAHVSCCSGHRGFSMQIPMSLTFCGRNFPQIPQISLPWQSTLLGAIVPAALGSPLSPQPPLLEALILPSSAASADAAQKGIKLVISHSPTG